MKTKFQAAALVALLLAGAVALSGCRERTDKTHGGGVLLSVSDFDGLPLRVSVNGTTLVQIEELTIQNVVKAPGQATSPVMNVEMDSYEVTFTRADTGTRLPPPYVRHIFGVAPVGGEIVYENLPVMSLEQLRNPPLSDLLVENGGFDKETLSSLIILNIEMRFFGRTLAGREVESEPFRFTVEFLP